MIEAEVRAALKDYFEREGFRVWSGRTNHSPGPDLVCSHPSQRRLWIIETKGWTDNSADRRGRFESGLGQICHRDPAHCKNLAGFGVLLSNEMVTYGLAFPDGGEYRTLCQSVRKEVQRAFPLYFLFVKPDVLAPTIIAPHDLIF